MSLIRTNQRRKRSATAWALGGYGGESGAVGGEIVGRSELARARASLGRWVGTEGRSSGDRSSRELAHTLRKMSQMRKLSLSS